MQLKEPLAASRAYQTALQLNNRSAEVLNNIAYSAFDLGCEVTALRAASCALQFEKQPNPEIAATLQELKTRSTTPTNHPTCPRIRCNAHTLAANEAY